MKWDINYNAAQGWIEARVDGSIDSKELKQFTEHVINELHRNESLKVFLDMRNAHLSFSVLDIYRLPLLFKQLKVDFKTHTALIPPLNNKQKALYDFFETVSFNKGYKVKQFDNTEEGKNWLHQI